ncbi:NAD(P)H-dependent glycerol-3-phosphate dehydrogenase [Patescibacteria group bacterium]|nr:NAD(P)H-dependent glycerol-3-phosphate dehydrogenase [Patescibacteria group bacterium]MBU1448895.1 NAD(P)H-dependent glycerol-3-phosphate dehydrogenase [Patescibacteria group bacterium]MBU2613299.1 NAD(P)H-dependent glycerol-3-phosphate dehydrogenase [Patescibacteria group bacterium]
MKSQRSIAVLGAGNMGTALALVLARHGRPVNVYCIESDVEDDINRRGRNTKYLRGIGIPANVRAHADIATALRGADTVIVAVPSFAVLEVIGLAVPHLTKGATVAIVTKGLDEKKLLPKVEISRNLLPAPFRTRTFAIGGPAIATELAESKPGAILLAGKDTTSRNRLARLFANGTLKVAVSDDVRGVGLCMSLKNPYAIGLGLCDGLGFPMNTKAFVLTLALEEMGRIVRAAGGDATTITTLAGLGDLVVSGFSSHGRNRTYGERLVKSRTKDPTRLDLITVEGIASTPLALRLSKKHKVRVPLLTAINACLTADARFERPFVEYLKHLSLL